MKITLDASDRQVAEVTARLIARGAAQDPSSSPRDLGIPDATICVLARAHVELCQQVRALHALVEGRDPADPVACAIAHVGLVPRAPVTSIVSLGDEPTAPRLVLAEAKIAKLSDDELLAIYCRVMHEVRDAFIKHSAFVVRVWDGMDDCWTDCTGKVALSTALRDWARSTDGGTRCVSYDEIAYYKIFPGDTRMLWDGSAEGGMHR